jgi:hypothetical protein
MKIKNYKRSIFRRGEGSGVEWGGPLWTQSGGLCGPWPARSPNGRGPVNA